MPTYDYVCTTCGHEFELMQKMSDPPRKRCPKCGKKVERKIGSGAGIIFKGSGFYATDYRSSDYQAKAHAEGPGRSSSAGKGGNGGAEKKGAPAKEGGNGSSSEGTKPAPK